MFGRMLGLLSANMAIDLGTANTVVYVKGRGIGSQHFPSVHTCARARAQLGEQVDRPRAPRNAGFPPMILPINRSLVGASGRAD
jgi:hypothetical protein